eukprot:m.4791 g.4791  ORF g.4791 m.4791 type:complete len:325 (-) comp2290_c0_seq2:155-1129(-)
MSEFAKVKEASSDAVVEVPVEEDGTILLSTLKSQFANATGLKYLNTDSGAFRAVRLSGEKFECPENHIDWGTVTFTVVAVEPAVESAKRSADGSDDEHPTKRANETGDNVTSTDPTSSSLPPSTHPDQASSDVPRTGAKECYNCGGRGHISSICTSPPHAKQSMGSDFTCHLCGGKGHLQAGCPSMIANNTCYQCGMVGHRARDCPAYRGDAMYGRGGNDYFRPRPGPGQKSCYTCGEFGHISANCPRGKTGEKICHICQQPGHIARDCNRCKICKKEGHRSYDCPEKQQHGGDASREYADRRYPPGQSQDRYQPDPYRNRQYY